MKKIKEITLATENNVFDLFFSQVQKNPKKIAIEFLEKKFTYEQVLKRVLQIGQFLKKKGCEAGDRIAILSENRIEYIEIQLACSLTGVILACQNTRLTSIELEYCIDLVKPKILFFSSKNKKKISSKLIGHFELSNLDNNFDKLIKNNNYKKSNYTFSKINQNFLILYTSGTTGFPKGAVITNNNIISRMCLMKMDWNIRDNDAFISWAPMYHMASTDPQLATLMSGGTVIIFDGPEINLILNTIEKYNIGWLVMLPGIIDKFIFELKKKKRKLKLIKCVGAMADLISRKKIAEITSLLNTPYANTFGSTETGLAPASKSLISASIEKYSLSKEISSLCRIKLKPHETDLKNNSGELLIKGPTVFNGYWQANETNRKDFEDGWFNMGDIFRLNKNGTLDFLDRSKYLIKSGGENIYPSEIEKLLFSDKRILEASVVKKKDEKWGETPVLFVATNSKAISKEYLGKIFDKKLARYKRPKEIIFLKYSDFPRSTSGKVLRNILEKKL